jgi:hypothetical protein
LERYEEILIRLNKAVNPTNSTTKPILSYFGN